MIATISPFRLPFTTWRRGLAAVMAALIGCATLAVVGAGTAQADPTLLHSGQVFASVGNSEVDVYDAASGNLVTSLNDGTGEAFTAGGTFDTHGNFYVTDDLNGDISEYDDQGNLLPLFASGLSNPLSLVFDDSGNLYVGQQTTPYVAEFDSNGNRLPDIGPMNTELYGVDWIDLASDQCTLYYTTEGTDILRYNKCTNTQLPNFNTTSFDPSQSAYELRILPDGSVLVADSDAILHLDASGNVTQTYSCNDLPGCAGHLFALNLDPDGTSFWTGDTNSGLIWQVDIATGQVLQTINANTAFLYGLTIDGQVTVATSPGGGSADVPTTLSVNPATSDYSVPATVSGVLTNSNTSAPIANEPVTFSLNGSETCTGTTDSTGTASCSITPEEAQGSYPLTASFAGDTTQTPSVLASNGSNTFVVTPDPTAITYTGTTATTNGQPANLSGVLTSFGNPLPDKTVLLTLGSGSSVQSCNATTNASGAASCSIASVNQTVGSVPVTASFAGDDYYVSSTDSSTASVDTDTHLKVNAATGDYNVATTVTGVLTNLNTSAAIAGEPVTFTLNGAETCSAITDGTGTASCAITPGEAEGSYPLTATFGGDTSASPVLLSSNGANTFVVTPDPTAITYTGDITATDSQPATLSGTLTAFGNPVAAKAVTLTLGTGGAAQSCVATTNASGAASCTIASVNQSVGSVPVTASFAGDSYYLSSTVTSSVTVSPPPPVPTTLTVHSASAYYNVSTTVSGVLTNSNTAAPLSGELITFNLNGVETCEGITDATGTATCSITPSEGKGTYPLNAAFSGDTTVSPAFLASTGTNNFVVSPDPTSITYTGATTATIGQAVTLSGTLTAFGHPVANKPVALTLGTGGAAQSCVATTDANGSTSCSIASVAQSAGSVPVTVSFAGDDYYLASTNSAHVTVSPPAAIPTTLTVNPANGDYNVATTVSGVLTNANTLAPIAGEPVALTLNGAETCSAITDATGTASCSITPGESKGTYPLTGTFAGDTAQSPALLASNGTNTFVVTPDPTALVYTGATAATNGQSATLSGTLTAFGNPLANKNVTFTLGTGGAAQICNGTTDAFGSASCTITSVNQSVGPVPVSAAFAGDNYYLASNASSTVTVSPPPPVPTTLTVNSASGDYSVPTPVSAVLTTTATSTPVIGEPVTLTLNGTETCTGITDATGTATCTLTPGEAKGTYPLSGTFGGDTSLSPTLLASSGAATFVVTPDPTALVYTGATAANNGQPATLSGVLTSFGSPLANKSVTLTLGTGGSAQSCGATTDASGSASCSIASVSQIVGSVPVTAAFAGDNYYLASNATSAVTVSPPLAIPTTLVVHAATSDYNVATTVSGVLTNTATSAPIAAEPVVLTLNGTESCTATTDATGTASCSITPEEAKGSYPLSGAFAGDTSVSPALLASSGTNTFVVTPDPTAITYTGATSVVNGQPATLSGTLTAFGSPLANKSVTLTLGSGGSAQSCVATTNASGSASCSIASVSQSAGSEPVTAAFAGDNYYLSSSAAITVGVGTPTNLSVNAATGNYGVATTVSGVLTNAVTSAPIAAEPVVLTLNGAETCSGITDATGTASCSITPGEAKGTYPLAGTFGGDSTTSPVLLASSGTNNFVVTPDPTVTLYTGATAATNGQSATLSGTLSVFGNPLSAKTLSLTLGSGGSAQSCSATTNASGSASCTIASVNQSLGSVPVTASFAGDNYYLASNASSSVAVSGPPVPTTLSVNAATGEYGFATTVSGVLTNAVTSAPIAAEPVVLTLNGAETCTGITDATGTASCSITPGEAKGSYTLAGTFAGDTARNPILLASHGSNTFVVTPDPTVIVYTGPGTAGNGQATTLSGVLTANGTALASKSVTLTLGSGGSAQSCSATTNASGSASCSIASVNQSVGSVPVTVSFAGDNYYLASSASSTVTVSPLPPIPTTLSVNAATGQYNVATTVSGVLTNTATSTPIAGESVTFQLNGLQTCSGVTNVSGTASCSITPGEAKGTYPLTGAFGGDTGQTPNLLASTGTNNFVVTPDPTAIVYTGTTTATNGLSATLSATLTAFGNPVAGRTVTLTLGPSSTAQSCTGTTNASGSASCTISAVNQSDGSVPVTAVFAGDNYYLASNASSSVAVTDQATASCLAGGENNLYSTSPSIGSPVSAGQTVSAVYSDESPLGTGSITNGSGNQTGGPAPAVFLGGVLQPASALSITNVANPPKDNQADATLSFTVPAGTPTGTTVEILFYDGDWSTSNWIPGTNPEIFPQSTNGTNGCGEAVWNSHTPIPTGTITGHIYQCTTSGTPIVPNTEVSGGYINATGTSSVSADDNPISFAVTPGTYTATATAPPGYTLVPCGGSAQVAAGGGSASVNNLQVTVGATTNVIFYADAVPLTPLVSSLKLNGANGQYGTATTVSAVLTDAGAPAPPGPPGPGGPPAPPAPNTPVTGMPVTFTLNGAETCTAITDSTGTATCSITPGEVPANNYSLTASFAGSTAVYPAITASTASENFNVTAAPTTLAYTGTTTAVNGASATLAGTLTSNGTPVARQPVSFTIGGGPTVQTCSGTTNSSGIASCVIAAVTQTAGSVPIAATFAGTADYTSSKAPGANLSVGVLTVLKVAATTGPYGTATTVSALLTNSNTSAAITNESVTLTLNGNETCTAVTNNTGTASCTITPSESAGTYSLVGTFAGDATKATVLYASSGSANFVVTPAVTNLSYTGTTAIVNGGSATLSGTLTTNGVALSGYTIVFTLGSGATAQSCSGTTSTAGAATCTIAAVNQSIGSVPVTASFAGNSYYQSATAAASANVYLTAIPPAGITYVNAKKGAGAANATCTGSIPAGVADVNTFPNAICSTDGNAGNTVSFDVELASGGTPASPTLLAATAPVTVTTTYTQTGGATFTSATSQTIAAGSSATVTPFSVNIVGGSYIMVTCSVTVGGSTVTLKFQVH